MQATNARSPGAMPDKERDLARLAYDVGPGVRYPGLEGATSVPALAFPNGLFGWLTR